MCYSEVSEVNLQGLRDVANYLAKVPRMGGEGMVLKAIAEIEYLREQNQKLNDELIKERNINETTSSLLKRAQNKNIILRARLNNKS